MSDLLIAPRQELIRLIYDLVGENQSLKTQIADVSLDRLLLFASAQAFEEGSLF